MGGCSTYPGLYRNLHDAFLKGLITKEEYELQVKIMQEAFSEMSAKQKLEYDHPCFTGLGSLFY
jgi:hypothetical protein